MTTLSMHDLTWAREGAFQRIVLSTRLGEEILHAAMVIFFLIPWSILFVAWRIAFRTWNGSNVSHLR
jgi:hypothetical protein